MTNYYKASVIFSMTFLMLLSVSYSTPSQASQNISHDVKSYIPKGVFVQLGAYSSDNGNIIGEHLGQLSSVGVVSLQKLHMQGDDLIRLRVGPYGSIDDAIIIRNELVKQGYKKARVVVEK